MKTLYHYCSVSTFCSIIKNQSIRLSSLSLSNDSLEGKMARESIARLSAKDDLPQETIDRLAEFVSYFDTFYDGMGFCLSEAKDLLSQWRGYADDGRGFCIGFSVDDLHTMIKPKTHRLVLGSVRPTLKQVSYQKDEHDRSLKSIYEKMREAMSEGALAWPKAGLLTSEEDKRKAYEAMTLANAKIFSTITELSYNLYTLKSAVFLEEQEWRILAAIPNSAHHSSDFRPTADNLIPYREVSLKGPAQKNIITEVIAGPKNKTPLHLVKTFLKNNEFENFAASLSGASYR